MNNYCINYHNENMIYELYAICIQDGGVNGGHYHCICKRDDKWYHYNDSIVNEIDKDSIFKFNPYCLFYKRTNC